MNEGMRKRAAEMVLLEYLTDGDTGEVEIAAKEAGRSLSTEEVHQLFEIALSQSERFAALRAARLITLTEEEKGRLLSSCWTTGALLEALEVTGKTLNDKEFHRLVQRAIENWGAQNFVIELVERTGFHLTDEEKKSFLDLMVRIQRKAGGYDGHALRAGLKFLGNRLSPIEAERLFTVMESCKFSSIEEMGKLAIIANGRVTKDRLLNLFGKVGMHINSVEKTVKDATGEVLTREDYQYLFSSDMMAKRYGAVLIIVTQRPEYFAEHDFTSFIEQCMGGDYIQYSYTMHEWQDAVSVAMAAERVGKLSLQILKELIVKIPRRRWGYDVIPLIEAYALALKRGLNPQELRQANEKIEKPRKRSK